MKEPEEEVSIELLPQKTLFTIHITNNTILLLCGAIYVSLCQKGQM